MIDRETFVALNRTMGGLDTFKLRQRRGQLPLLDKDQRRGRGYFLIEAYLTSLVEEFRTGWPELSLTLASEIVSDAVPGLREQWSEIVARSNPGRGDVLIGRAVLRGGKAVPFVGTPEELTFANLMSGEGLVRIIATSASGTFAGFDRRCQIANAEVPADFDLWKEVEGDAQ